MSYKFVIIAGVLLLKGIYLDVTGILLGTGRGYSEISYSAMFLVLAIGIATELIMNTIKNKN